MNRKRRKSAVELDEKEIEESSTEVVGLCLLIVFLTYVCIGALFLPLLNGEFDFANGIYHNFISTKATRNDFLLFFSIGNYFQR